ncbi:hypothetical protein BDK61_0646 [Haloarcula quadrata]|uniref:Phage PhiH1 repressor protein n=1 Tax=Haloarcula quadrata TaxID=182779 RepID=A0A495R267_9EURY|nr:MarR family transcriptional regulator [Haloarcula quadrata]RKS81367.1 hypothetical protein BDK61_0646 [Haloarcula quadrata]
MRLSAEWTTLADERILEYLQEHKSGTPTKMANHPNIHFSRSYLHKRCDVLVEKSLIADYGNAVFVLTDEGEAYLAGELNLNELEPDGEE